MSRRVPGRVHNLDPPQAFAAGRYDGYWERNLTPWDLAAGIVLVREAGGLVSDVSGKDTALATGDVLAGNSAITKALLPLLAH